MGLSPLCLLRLLLLPIWTQGTCRRPTVSGPRMMGGVAIPVEVEEGESRLLGISEEVSAPISSWRPMVFLPSSKQNK